MQKPGPSRGADIKDITGIAEALLIGPGQYLCRRPGGIGTHKSHGAPAETAAGKTGAEYAFDLTGLVNQVVQLRTGVFEIDP